jgi:hypothetical protein
MMSPRSKKPGNRASSGSLDWRQFQARLQKLLSVFHEVAAHGRAPKSAPAAQEPVAGEAQPAVQPRAHLPTILDHVGIKLDDQPTRAQLLRALAGVLDACRRAKTN